MATSKLLVAFVPVLHKGYIELFKKYPGRIALLGKDIMRSYTSLTRDVRVVDPRLMRKAILALGIVDDVVVLGADDLQRLKKEKTIVMPDEDVCRDIARKYLRGVNVIFVSTFLRWDNMRALSHNAVSPNRIISRAVFDKTIMKLVAIEAERSSDWWRAIGAAIVKGKKVIAVAHNHHLPTDYHLAAHGDPRSNFDAGEHSDVYTSIHAEAQLIATSAKNGVTIKGASIYVTTFPCSNCARLLGEAGIAKVFYRDGYSRLDGEKILRNYGIKIILIRQPMRV